MREKQTLLPKLRFPEFRDAGVWEGRNLGGVAENLDNRRVPITSGERVVGIIPYYGASGVVDYVKGFIFDEDLLCVSEDGANLVARTYPIAFPISGKTWVNNHAHVLRFQNLFTQKFVEVYLNSIKLDDFITGMAQPKLNKAMLDSIPIPWPTVPEQQRIADCLASLDELITLEAQKLDTLKTHKKGLMQQLFPAEGETLPKLRFSEFREPWIETTLGNLCSSISSGRDQIDPDGGFDLYGSTSVIGKTKSPSFSGVRILVARVGANAGMLTRAKGEFGVTDNTLVVSLNPSINMDFLFHYLGNININRLIFGSGQPLITGSILKNLPIPIPADSEQQKISACLSLLDEMISDQSSKLEAIKTHKKGLMQQLFPSIEEVEA